MNDARAEVDFYFGPGSRYSYLASTQLDAIAARTGARFRWRPLFSSDLARAAGYAPFAGAPTSGQYEPAYRDEDIRRWAAFYRAPYVADPDLDQAQWRRLTLAIVAAGDHVEAFARALYHAQFAEGASFKDVSAICAVAAKVGISDMPTRLAAPDLETRAGVIVAEARGAGAFGAPSFVVDGQLFFGNDRLVLLEHHLQHAVRRV